MYDHGQVEAIAAMFKAKGVDALFVPHCDFGQEEAVAKLAKLLKVPVLVWGPRDGSPDGSIDVRGMGDVQCGLFATGRALLRYDIPFTYIENCWLDHPALEKGIKDFVRAASVVKAFRNARVLQLGPRPRQFLSVKVNEGELMEKFGVEVTPVSETELLDTINNIKANKQDKIAELLAEWDARVDLSAMPEEKRVNMACIELAILELAEMYQCNTVATECWKFYHSVLGVATCFVNGDLSAKGLSVACETDIHGAISSLLVNALTRMETPSFLADITVRHPYNDNGELLWHCGPFPYQLAKDKTCKPKVDGGRGEYELQDGTLTLVRFEVNKGQYTAFIETCKAIDGPATQGNYVWIETNDWVKWEKKLVCGPYIHHIVGAYGDYKDAMIEACKYIGITPDTVD